MHGEENKGKAKVESQRENVRAGTDRHIYTRADSFKITDRIRYDKYAWYKMEFSVPTGGTRIKYYPETGEAEMLENGQYNYLELSQVANIDNFTYRLYFICPYCGRRVRYLYRNSAGYYACRKCSRLNYRSQQLNDMDLQTSPYSC